MPDRILIVDDEGEFAKALSLRIQARGMTVDVAGNGYEAIEKAQAVPYDAIILDIQLPGIDGLETLRRLRAQNPELQVILLTGHATWERGVEAMKLGALEFMDKPADFAELMKTIGQAQVNKILLVQKEAEKRIEEILKKRAW